MTTAFQARLMMHPPAGGLKPPRTRTPPNRIRTEINYLGWRAGEGERMVEKKTIKDPRGRPPLPAGASLFPAGASPLVLFIFCIFIIYLQLIYL